MTLGEKLWINKSVFEQSLYYEEMPGGREPVPARQAAEPAVQQERQSAPFAIRVSAWPVQFPLGPPMPCAVRPRFGSQFSAGAPAVRHWAPAFVGGERAVWPRVRVTPLQRNGTRRDERGWGM